MSWNLRLEYPKKVKKFNETSHTSFVKHYIYQKVHYLHIQAIYPLPAHFTQAFEQFFEMITRLMHAAYRKIKRIITGCVK